jgi:hypothetical protein
LSPDRALGLHRGFSFIEVELPIVLAEGDKRVGRYGKQAVKGVPEALNEGRVISVNKLFENR